MTTALHKIADTPPTQVRSDTAVAEAVRVMIGARVGAVAVIDGGALVGIFTERDLMRRVVGEGRDAAATLVRDVMVRDPLSVSPETSRSEALDLMLQHHFRHLPIVDAEGVTQGMLSIRNLLHHQMERLRGNVQALEQYLGADGPGG